MSAIATAFASRSVPNLAAERGQFEGLRSWLTSGAYSPRVVSPTIIHLDRITISELLPYLCYDYARFALASWETFSVLKAEAAQCGSLGWSYLKLYYSTFFAGHALMRSTGMGVIRVEAETKKIEELMGLYGIEHKLQSGNYLFSLKQSPDLSWYVVLEYLVSKKRSGAHDVFWQKFAAFLEGLQVDVATRQDPQANEIIGSVGEILTILKSGGTHGGWMSQIRNQINYRHLHDVWFPVADRRKKSSLLNAVSLKPLERIRLDIDVDKHALKGFLAAGHFLVELNRDVADRIAGNSKSQVCFGAQWRRLRKEFKDGKF